MYLMIWRDTMVLSRRSASVGCACNDQHGTNNTLLLLYESWTRSLLLEKYKQRMTELCSFHGQSHSELSLRSHIFLPAFLPQSCTHKDCIQQHKPIRIPGPAGHPQAIFYRWAKISRTHLNRPPGIWKWSPRNFCFGDV